ncbi:sperm acrosome membrane-associated protein 3 isoform X1 [Sorex fumeus]|uniref:sperm acrosome membrane-associated protein 3 isoform X1 n=1 Tax=Sorex fumeus TaxID=62283 RepID=UPI0024ACDA9C|nr:sperm acrosome membrane-associated protein 3 isoform X1 [Sorex fumeus]
METVVIVAIGVLATIFLASFAALVVVCRQRYCRPRDLLQRYDSKPIVDLIGAMETQSEPSELELDDVVITNPHIEAILENEDWIEDASGLMSHCIAILKICHTLTEKLVAMTMGSGAKMKTSASVGDIIVVAKRISPRVDDVVKSMYPPLDPKLLDARERGLSRRASQCGWGSASPARMNTRRWAPRRSRCPLGILLLASLLASCQAKVYSRCALARVLQDFGLEGYRGYSLADWVCLAYYTSGFNTAAVDHEADGSTNNGLFQINSRKWCKTLNSELPNLCQIYCNELLNPNLKDSVICAMKIVQQASGLGSWETWRHHCQGKDLSDWVDGCDV